VQERVLATPELGPTLAREAWRRVLLEPLVTSTEDDAKRLAATCATQRIYTNFFRIALDDSDGFIPREAARLAAQGRGYESRTMLAFAEAVRRAKLEAPVTSADFDAVERWASLLVRRGHWAMDAIPPAGEERVRYLGTLSWYGVAPPAPEVSRIWVGPRLLVRESDTEGFVADDVPATGVGCPIAWRAQLEQTSATGAWASAWFVDHPEFRALATFAVRVGHGIADQARQVAARGSRPEDDDTSPSVPTLTPLTVVHASARSIAVVPLALDTTGRSGARGEGAMDSLRMPAAAARGESTGVDSIRAGW